MDLSNLTDDQLIELARIVLTEAITRNAATSAGVEMMILDARAKQLTAKAATLLEAQAARSDERARLARRAAAEIAAQRAQRNAVERMHAAEQQAEKARLRVEKNREILEHAARLLRTEPQNISIWRVNTKYGLRLLINSGHNRYARSHLADYNATTGNLKAIAGLDRAKLAAFMAETLAVEPVLELSGKDYA